MAVYDYGNEQCNILNHAIDTMCRLEDSYNEGSITEEILLRQKLDVLRIVDNAIRSEIKHIEEEFCNVL